MPEVVNQPKNNCSFLSDENNSGVMLSMPNGNTICLFQFHEPKMLQCAESPNHISKNWILHFSIQITGVKNPVLERWLPIDRMYEEVQAILAIVNTNLRIEYSAFQPQIVADKKGLCFANYTL